MNSRRPRLRALLPALLVAAGCKDPVVEVIPGVNSAVEIVLANPTDCPVCDPFANVDTLRLDVSVGGDVVASDTFAYPGEDVVLPDLTGFGVVRFTLVGLVSGRVFSVGRTPEVVLLPDTTLTVPLVFLPANRVLPLAAPMIEDRYRPTAIVRRGGDVLIVGGLDPMRSSATAVAELYDPATSAFTELGPTPARSAGAVATALPDGQWLFSGGVAVVGGNEVAVADAYVFDDATAAFAEAGPFTLGRTDHCVAMFRERQGLALGGADGEGDYLTPDAEGTWAFETLGLRDLDSAAVTACATASEGVVFVQGRDAASTGVWDESGGEDPSEAFRAVSPGGAGDIRYVAGPALLPVGDGTVRVLGGADVDTGEVFADGRLFSADARRFSAIGGFQVPRFDARITPWIEEGWYVAGCGWADAERTAEEPTVELVAPGGAGFGPLVALDRDRAGCALAGLPDGSVLVAGGGPRGVPDGASAALLVPWLDLADTE